MAFGYQAVASGTSAFLLIMLERFRHPGVNDIANVGFVDAHAECHRRHDNIRFFVDESVLTSLSFPSLAFDGVYHEDSDGRVRFRRPPQHADAEVKRVTASIVTKIQRLLERRGLGPQAGFEEADPLPRDQPLLAELYGASVQGRIAVGPDKGKRLKGIRFVFEAESKTTGRCCSALSGFTLHAAVRIPGKPRDQLETLCRYVARTAMAAERSERTSRRQCLESPD